MSEEKSAEFRPRKSSKGTIRSSVAWKGYVPANGLRVVVRPERRGNGGPKDGAGEIVAVHRADDVQYFSIRFDGKAAANRPINEDTLHHFYFPESFWKKHLREVEESKQTAFAESLQSPPLQSLDKRETFIPQPTEAVDKLTRAVWALESTVRGLDKAITALGFERNVEALQSVLQTHGKVIQDSAIHLAEGLEAVKAVLQVKPS